MENPSAPPGKAQKYARVERERRWLLREQPDPRTAIREVDITDAYLEGTRLRLRQVLDVGGDSPPVYKLTQKVSGSGGAALVTNTYLSKTEYERLSQLGGHVLTKTRFSVPPFGVDVFAPPLDGLVLAEAEFESDETMQACEAPQQAVAEVTGDVRFTGGRLAMINRPQMLEALAALGLRPA